MAHQNSTHTDTTHTDAAHAVDLNVHNAHDPDVLAHPLPIKLLVNIFGLLMFFTFLTVAATWVDLGNFNIWIAMGIALIKAVLVCLYFMHLRYDSPFYSVALVSALLFVSLFMGIVLVDSHQYDARINALTDVERSGATQRVPELGQ